MKTMLSDNDKAQIKSHGLSLEKVNQQIENFCNGFEYLPVSAPAVVGDGIHVIAPEKIAEYTQLYKSKVSKLRVVKFVPASGAATRMFKDLFEFVNDDKRSAGVDKLLENIEHFAFYPALHRIVAGESDPKKIVSAIIKHGLNYGAQPKALILFHSYKDSERAALEEHLAEGAMYAVSNGNVNIHFTVSPEHKNGFDTLLKRAVPQFEKKFGVKYNISFSQQQSSTDTIAVTPGNEPFREGDGSLLFRPAGHGALIENLNSIDADVIFIKNIDNVTTDRLKADTITYKEIIAGMLLKAQEKIFDMLNHLDKHPTPHSVTQAAELMESGLSYKLPIEFMAMSADAKLKYVREVLNRPLRVCGMVKNDGEPGGGPFWVQCSDGSLSLQIAESSQISPAQEHLMNDATHFNPVDLVCAVKDYRGKKFDLTQYIDHSTGFISNKSKDGRELKAQELPGLWNGAMARWNTLFVEVPVSTFSPVKVVTDLLRDQHQ